MYDDINYWDEFEYSKLKLLCHKDKVQSLMDVYTGVRKFDNLPPISVEMHLTNNCNLRCPWCTDRNLQGGGEYLTEDKVFELLKYFGQSGTGVTLEGGGEPTVHPSFKRIAEYGAQNNVDLGLITNGTIDISDVINDFKWVRVSLDSSCEAEYKVEKGVNTFSHVISNLEKIRDKRDNRTCFLGIGYVITTRNTSHIEEIVKQLDELKVDYIYFRPVEEAPDITPSRDELYDLRKKLLNLTENLRIKIMFTINDRLIYDNAKLPCVAHSITSIIHADGDVACCEKRRHDPIVLGNVNLESFNDIWSSELKMEITQRLLCAECQNGCSVCRITPFNKIVDNLVKMNTKRFI